MASQDNIRGLKIVVISLGVVLVGGFVFVVGAVANQFRQGNSGAKCEPTEIALPASYAIDSAQIQEKRISLTLRNGKETRILIVDSCNGKTLSELTFK